MNAIDFGRTLLRQLDVEVRSTVVDAVGRDGPVIVR